LKLSITLCFIIFWNFCSYSQFGNEQILANSLPQQNSILSSDFDLDGDEDIITADFVDDKISLFENLGNGDFGEEIILTNLTNGIKYIHVADLDNDGDDDLISGSSADSKVAWYENLGGNFGPQQILSSSASNPIHIHTVDIDNDGDLEIFAALYSSNEIVWFDNLGSGNFGALTILSSSTVNPNFIQSSDFNSDGYMDIAYSSYGNNISAWHENLGNGTFGPQQIISTGSGVSHCINTIDVDGDLDDDIISSFGAEIIWQENLGGSFGPQQIIESQSDVERALTLDFNNDGNMDYVEYNNGTSGRIRLYMNNGNGTFTSQVITSLIDGLSSISKGDINNDGFMDLLGTSTFDRDIFWFENLGNGTFSSERFISTQPSLTHNLIGVDLDMDGDNDLLASSGGDNKILWSENIGGDFSKLRVIDFIKFDNFATSGVSVTYADIDNDGDNDIAAVTVGDSTIGWYENLGNGTFGSSQIIADTIRSYAIGTVDSDNDGDYDIICGSHFDDAIYLFENLGNSTFSSAQLISYGVSSVTEIHFSDLNSDGNIDIITCSYSQSEIYWFENLGGNQFAPAIYINGTNNTGIALADLDNDGDEDLVYSGSYLGWQKNNGFGVFQAGGSITFSPNAGIGVTTSDLDGDGDQDVLIPLGSIDGFSWFENMGNATFGPQQITLSIGSTQKITTSDLDGDGDEEIILGSSINISVFENQLLNDRQIQGRIFIDLNQNLIHDSTDIGLSQVQILSSPISDFTYSYPNGDYFMNFSDSNGVYSIFPSNLQNWSIVTDSLSYSITIDSTNLLMDSLDFGIYPDTIIYQVNPELIGAFPRCNTTTNYWINIQNTGTTISSGIINLALDDSITYVSSNLTPDSIVGQNIYWHYDSLFYFSDTLMNVIVQMPDFNSMGDTVVSFVTVSATDSLGSFVANYQDSLYQVISCAYDPNDKKSNPEGLDSLGFVDPNTTNLEYTIRFQNTGNDTALVVVLRDYLDDNLDWTSLTPLGSSHNANIHVEQDGELIVTFDSIMLPDSTVDESGSHGFFKYKIDLNPNLPLGTSIYNTANIFFDLNPPVVTNTEINTLYDCSGIFSSIANQDTLVCKNSYYDLSADLSVTTLDWNITNVSSGIGNEISWLADTSGVFDLSINASNLYCSADTTITLYVPNEISIQLPNEFICSNDSILLFNDYQSVAGLYSDTLQTTLGCDSIVSKELIVFQVNLNIDSMSICQGDSILIFNNYVSNSGIYYDSLQNLNGCDSIIGKYLNLLSPPNVVIGSFPSDTLCVYSAVVALDNSSPVGGTYSGLGVTGANFDPSSAGLGTHLITYSFTDTSGCTSSDSQSIFIDGCLSLGEIYSNEIRLFPNPSDDWTMVEFGDTEGISYEVIVYDLLGRKVFSESSISSPSLMISKSKLGAGSFIIKVFDENSRRLLFLSKFVMK
jgi:uncharacterized repeat protein (TIGR01451 family)